MKCNTTDRRGEQALTLLELVVVLGILAVISGLITYSLNPNTLTFGGVGRNRTSAHIATETSMKAVKEAILGTPGMPGYWYDMEKINVAFPQYTAQLFFPPDVIAAATPTNVFSAQSGTTWFQKLVSFNPAYGKGWRGPYINGTGSTFPYTAEAASRYFSPNLHPPGFASCPVPVDGWGNPIVIQWGILNAAEEASFSSGLAAAEVQVKHARMVSAGPNGVLDTLSPAGRATLYKYPDFVADRQPGGARLSGDDVISFFFWPELE